MRAADSMSEAVLIEQVRVEIVQVLRHKVLHANEPYERSVYAEDRLFDAQHFAAFLPKKIVGAASVYKEVAPFEIGECAKDAWRVRGLAVLPEHRNRGCGKMLLQTCAEFVKIQRGAVLWCRAPLPVAAFFRATNFEIVDKILAIGNAEDNCVMRLWL